MEINKARRALVNNKGSGFPLAVAVTLCLVMVFAGVSEYLKLMIISQGVCDTLQNAVISTVSENYDDVYHGVREGYSGGYQPIDSDFEESVDYGNIYDKMDTSLGLNQSGEYHSKISSEGKTEFKIWDLDVEIQNAPFADGDKSGQRFKIDSSIILEVPVSFGGKLLPCMQIKVKNSAGYTPEF